MNRAQILMKRLAQLSVGGRDYDADFMEAIGFEVARAGRWSYKAGACWCAIPHVTTDATSIIRYIRCDFPHSRFQLRTADDGERFNALVWGGGVPAPTDVLEASTPALALCLAYLYAGKDGWE